MRDALNPCYVKQKEQFLDKVASRAVAKAKAFNVLLPAVLTVSQVVPWSQARSCTLRSHEQPTSSHERLEDSMDCEEAAEAAVDKRKSLLTRLFETPQVPDEEEKDTSQVDDAT